jgi:predicted Zn-dependent protease
MREAEREALAARVLAFADAGERGRQTEAIVFTTDAGLTRFTQNAIHQNVAHTDTSVRVRTVADGRTGVAATNALDDASLRETVDRARRMAALAPRDDDAPGLTRREAPSPQPDAFDERTAAATPADRASVVAEIVATAERRGLWAAGYVASERSGITIANTAGTLASFDGTSCGLNVKENGADATGFAERYSVRFADLDGAHAGNLAAEKATLGAAPAAVPPGAWTVILEPPAFGELLSYLGDHFSARAYDEGTSFLSAGLDHRYAGHAVSLADDYAHPLLCGRPFDFEGYPTRRVPLLERGVARELLTDATWAKRLGRPNTGHGLPAPNADGPSPRNLVVSGGEASIAELVAGTARGLLISRFWYIRPVDQRKTIVTGMTRDGTFLIENGEIVRGVRNMRFNQSILAALEGATLSREVARTGGYNYTMVVPSARIDGFHFTSGTDF